MTLHASATLLAAFGQDEGELVRHSVGAVQRLGSDHRESPKLGTPLGPGLLVFWWTGGLDCSPGVGVPATDAIELPRGAPGADASS